MSKLFKNKYRSETTRLQNWNYANEGMYFITICTKNREHYFGEITNTKMNLTEIGNIVRTEWLKTVELRPDMNLQLGEFIVMPDHFHSILIIGENKYNTGVCRDGMHPVPTNTHPVPTNTHRVPTIPNQNTFGRQSKNLASIIRGYKSSVTTYARKNKIEFAWQSRFHDHIIRSFDEYIRISNYIINNPANWGKNK